VNTATASTTENKEGEAIARFIEKTFYPEHIFWKATKYKDTGYGYELYGPFLGELCLLGWLDKSGPMKLLLCQQP
jgi:hypothetical protein